MNRTILFAVAALAFAACDQRSSQSDARGGGPAPVKNAMDACRRFESAGAATGCHTESVEPALTPGARDRVLFTLPSGKRGQVFTFDDKKDYEKSAGIIEDMSSAGKHRWGNESSKVYVQLNKDATDDEARKVKDVLDSF
jgi:hypothetical protein